ncbi:bifunctional DNA-binding transcriptional regulator/O6-methylguanine-DNA methyltransferase Ada [Roseisolibacter sp. H3M3-2]|uniref:bifunctional DNA-binding transcriptional regulator/O6-methylguanine-DNA methyltransferase Ada n=1 Tax=Roseisolibacter sp. H3M3-2 TaxID=3031323 RepID=UPI0023DAC507|nr:bifunctional DNA-binding transcriptional regulator/O6-methylguanine-DNA methyltransferase Ada [Roseisolibacter sp. H3M3-2]MDF1505867.1 bifunctional DNA-binding transcriptional regulator/O6-methylguanine-DNA methyltransferase Ada [Roseisolibacter sp. H3M3-2]
MHDTRDADRRWDALVARDRAHDGAFVYGVRTTGVYCRPSCASRRPRRENVAFFDAAEAARAAGFRACKRCRPDAPPEAEPAFVARARARLDTHAASHDDRALPLAELAAHAGASPAHLQRTFTRVVGLSPRAYLDARRLAHLKTRLRAGDTVSRAAAESGFPDGRGVYARAPRALGMSPAAWRRGGRGERVDYAVVPTRLGALLVAATARGVCAVALGDDEPALARWLQDELPAAELARGDEVDGYARAVAAWVDGDADDAALHALPLDLAGTDFQQRVWRALRAIPYGATRTYAELAAALGDPRAARAVAGACAANRVALVVPCHRVVRGDGAPGGYRWGAERKARLLDAERNGGR